MAAAPGRVEVDVPLDIAEVDRVRSAVTSAVSEAAVGARQVVVDLAGCEFVDAVGYRLLSEVGHTAERSGVTLQVVGASDSVLRVLTVLDTVLRSGVRVMAEPRAAAPRRRSVDSAP